MRNGGGGSMRFSIDREKLACAYPTEMKGDTRARLLTALSIAGMMGLAIFAMYWLDFSFRSLSGGLENLRSYLLLMLQPTAGGQLPIFLKALGETVAIALLGTLLAATLALPVGFLAAANVLPSFVARFFLRRVFDTCRSVDTLIWALVWISVVGLGPFAGVLAIATSDFGALAKLFSEAIENTRREPGEGVIASGGAPLERIRFAILPQVIPALLSQVIYFFESNTRSATIIGIVGAGGIGQYLKENIDQFEWEKVSFLIILVLILVPIIDFICRRLRFAIIGSARVLIA